MNDMGCKGGKEKWKERAVEGGCGGQQIKAESKGRR